MSMGVLKYTKQVLTENAAPGPKNSSMKMSSNVQGEPAVGQVVRMNDNVKWQCGWDRRVEVVGSDVSGA
eukprot:1525958-Amphidinium_carterae.4